MKHNIIIADDHKMFLDGLISILQNEEKYNILFTSQNGKNVMKYLEINSGKNVDLVITDISMPEIDGITLNKMMKKDFPSVKTLVLSMHKDMGKIERLIQDNVDGYILKNAEKEELLNAIDTILTGNKYFSKEVQSVYTESIFSKREEKKIVLTDREIDVITLIANEYTTQEIADKLCLSKYTVESHRKTLFAKLNAKNLAGLTKYAIKMGYIES